MPLTNISTSLYNGGKRWFANLIGRSSSNISDINKAAANNTINMVCLFTDNVPLKTQQKILEAVSLKTSNTICTVIEGFSGTDPQQTLELLTATLKNGTKDNPMGAVGQFNARLSEALQAQGINAECNITFGRSLSESNGQVPPNNSNTQPTSPVTGDKKAQLDALTNNIANKVARQLKGNGAHSNAKVNVKQQSEKAKFEYTSNKPDEKFFTYSQQHKIIIRGISDATGQDVETVFAFTIKINAITLKATELLEGIGEVNNRDTFYQYLKMRAGKASFFKDVLLNIKSLKSMAQRNTSGRLEDRVIAQLISGSNVLAPDFLKDIYEFKKFTVVITLDDADILRSEYNLSVTRSSDCVRMFNNMSMLTLIVLDLQDAENAGVMIIDSDKPSQPYTYRLKVGDSDNDKLLKLLKGVSR